MMDRRTFLGSLAVAVGAGPLVACSGQTRNAAAPVVDRSRERLPYTDGFGSMPCSKCIAPPVMTSSITIPEANEPGERMVISGTIFQADGKTPASGVVLYVYHTDATGYYSKDDDPYNPRLRDWMKTGADGKYEFRTIKPAPYPHRKTPAHIHAQVYSDTIPEYAIDEYWFEGDPFINAEQKKLLLTGRGGPGSIVKLSKDAGGTLRGTRNIILDAAK